MLTSNGLQKLNLDTDSEHPDTIDIASLIVKRLPNLEMIELNCCNRQVSKTLHILINGLPRLNFIIFHGGWMDANDRHSTMCDLPKYSTRPCRMEYCNPLKYEGAAVLYVWLS